MKVKTSIVEELFESESTEWLEGWRYRGTADMGTGRWESHHWLILENEYTGSFYAIEYSQGLTENQDSNLPWRPDYSEKPESLDLFRVYPEPVVRVDWKRWKE